MKMIKKRIGVLSIIILSLFLISFVSAAGTSFDDAELITDYIIEGSYGGQTEHYYHLDFIKSGIKVNLSATFIPDKDIGERHSSIQFKESEEGFPSPWFYVKDGELKEESVQVFNEVFFINEENFNKFLKLRSNNPDVNYDYRLVFDVTDLSDMDYGRDAPGIDNSAGEPLPISAGNYDDCCWLTENDRDSYLINLKKEQVVWLMFISLILI